MAHLILAETYTHLSKQNDARKHVTEILGIATSFWLAEFSKSTFYSDPSHLEISLEVLRKAELK
jgi:hypothetical protein